MKVLKSLFVATALFAGLAGSSAALTITKSPDLGAYWSPISNNSTYIYANSFVASAGGNVTGLGTWLLGDDGPDIRFQVYGSIGGNPANGPDSTNVLATTGVIAGMSLNSLTFIDGGLVTSLMALTMGETYWFGASVVGIAGGGSGSYQTGGHTQNSAFADNGTFWYSNDVNGLLFDGQALTPEMAFSVTIDSAVVPEPDSLALLALGLLAAGTLRARRAIKT
ncbi:MAG: PEP-CTERM sorting domain-containing protein [Burkholderiales bacterium]|nr:PEP-CTERM sorting domain-containing protein [Burkholderiales bacterium]